MNRLLAHVYAIDCEEWGFCKKKKDPLAPLVSHTSLHHTTPLLKGFNAKGFKTSYLCCRRWVEERVIIFLLRFYKTFQIFFYFEINKFLEKAKMKNLGDGRIWKFWNADFCLKFFSDSYCPSSKPTIGKKIYKKGIYKNKTEEWLSGAKGCFQNFSGKSRV